MVEVVDTAIPEGVTDDAVLQSNVELFRERGILLPTVSQMRDPSQIPASVLEKLKNIGLNDLHPLNLFRINWHNEPVESGGLFRKVPNHIVIPPSLSGVESPIAILCGSHFPIGAHKVGATYFALADAITRGMFNPRTQKALWPSTGNYARGGAFDCCLMGCKAICVLPEEMSKERFDWLQRLGAEVHATPGGEANVHEVYMKTYELKGANPDTVVVFNQFEQWGNAAFHKHVTGPAVQEVFEAHRQGDDDCIAALFSTMGSAGTINSSEYLKEIDPHTLCIGGEAVQCPTLYNNGHGVHRIEGIGDRHAVWIQNMRHLDAIVCIDDELCMRLFRLFNEPVGHKVLIRHGVPQETIDQLHELGISGIANMIGSIKTSKYYGYQPHEWTFTFATDSAAMYQSRLKELEEERGAYTELDAELDFAALQSVSGTDYFQELTVADRHRCHNLKYYTWIEQGSKTVTELDQQWTDRKYFVHKMEMGAALDERIRSFNERSGMSQQYQ